MPELERVQQNTPLTLSHQWTEDGSNVDPGTVTVDITRWDGTVVETDDSTGGTLTAPRTYNLNEIDHTNLLDRLTVTWDSTLKGTLVSYVEVVGGFLFPLQALKALVPTASDADLIEKRLQAEQALERALGVAFVPRYERETITGDGGTRLAVTWPKVRAVRSATATVNGTTTTLSASDLLALTWGDVGVYGYTWTSRYPWTVGYEHGWDYTPEPVRDAALAVAHHYLTSGSVGGEGVDGRVEYITTPEGRINYGAGALGLPAVQRAASLYDLSVGVA